MTPTASRRLAFLLNYLDLPAATDDPEAEWEEYQIRHLNNSSLFGITTKSRQVGWSWTIAAEAVADSALNKRTPNIFVSINLEESREKIRYARQIIDALDREVRPALIIDNQLELEMQNGSRMISHPSKPVRGKAKGNVKLDELAHYPKDSEIYTSAVPVISKGGRLRAGSSPMGAGGVFHEIVNQPLIKYPGYTRDYVPWWVTKSFCKDMPEAKKLAPHMTTEERVMLFGKPRLIIIFQNLPLLDFQQEYECMFVDEATAWITWDEIKRNQELAQAGQLVYFQAATVDEAMQAIDD
ncbi:MAG: hypothetical protein HND51_21335, partial [Chloroflexi bacterium]|nr:hypothetical protein [Chloroflexota bacterium]NOH14194.1 hypothetical protein [Chloroflexota bacterium]